MIQLRCHNQGELRNANPENVNKKSYVHIPLGKEGEKWKQTLRTKSRNIWLITFTQLQDGRFFGCYRYQRRGHPLTPPEGQRVLQ